MPTLRQVGPQPLHKYALLAVALVGHGSHVQHGRLVLDAITPFILNHLPRAERALAELDQVVRPGS